MGFVSILDNRQDEWEEVGMPAFFVDFNLDQILNQIQGMSRTPIKKYYYILPENKDCEEYRRKIYRDVKKQDVNTFLTDFTERVWKGKEIAERKMSLEPGLQYYAWHVLEAAGYCEMYTLLYKELSTADIDCEGLKLFRDYLKEYLATEAFICMQKRAVELNEELQGFRINLVFENEQLYVCEGDVPGTYEKFLEDTFGACGAQMKSPFSQSVQTCSLEDEILKEFAKSHKKFFQEIKEFYLSYTEYQDETLIRFGDEISYYLSYYKFQKHMELKGFSFSTPTVDEDKDMSAMGLYDLALACVNVWTGKEVVSNDMCYLPGERFFVLTGPNQGGKTTFARSLGQLIYFSKMGLDVPATAANVYSFSNILSHFSVEESVETGRGKLMEELVRLKPMMNEKCDNAFVIINELFTTAANYDACIMGKKVLNHFISEGCMGIYVTHLKELSTAHEKIVSLKAMLDENKVQSFKIVRHEADDSVCSLNQVEKYRLTYEQLKERMG